MIRKALLSTVATLLLAGSLTLTAQAVNMQDKGYWKATSNTARSITGDIQLGAGGIAINFAVYKFFPFKTLTGDDVKALFNLDAAPTAGGQLYRMTIPGDKKFLHKNTLCGSEDVQWMATYVSDAGKTMQVALFSGAKLPDFNPEALMNATNLCGTFTYSR